ncbi:DUF2721 domain-containing protein [Natroniella sulfidigena]|uniref:DUF2721 domain-containing protein n=1 Tax=Natroniella sulfidigena TaxID=723921 RepID=UPI00200ACDF5|nr:DUF2721 domain-containing protein [Natroniella sulfidigena]MCK8818027.1 DUF2721 domain-containing protein [Natroniella sulfidigena]
MEFDLTTPALIFSMTSLLLLAYTNRFLALAKLIRELHSKAKKNGKDRIIDSQLASLRKRVKVIRNMQFLAILSLFFCVLSMLLLFFGSQIGGKVFFVIGLATLLVSLIFSAIEINLSVNALNIQLSESVEYNSTVDKGDELEIISSDSTIEG